MERRIEDVIAVDPHRAGAEFRRQAVAFLMSLVQMPAARPYTELLALSTISFGSEKGIAVTTGPKISSFTTFIFSLVSTSTVGFTK
jgi:uncharacterized membrane protein